MATFWFVLSAFYFVLSALAYHAKRNLDRDLGELNNISPSGIINKNGKAIGIETTLYKAVKSMLITDAIGFVLASGAAVVTIFVSR